MTQPADQIVRVNRVTYSWTDALFKANNTQFIGFTKVGWKQKREREKVPVATQDGQALGMTDGTYALDSMTWTMLSTSWDIFTDFLCNLVDSDSYGDAKFDFTAQLTNPRLAVRPITTFIKDCCVRDEDEPYEGPGGQILVNVTFDALYATRNGKSLFKSPHSV